MVAGALFSFHGMQKIFGWLAEHPQPAAWSQHWVGGILEPADATRLFDAGASLVQLYTGLIYRGPGLVRRINRGVT